MIWPQEAWCIQVSITELCWPTAANGEKSACSNCTRGIAHIAKRNIMALDDIERAVEALRLFPTTAKPCPQGRRKVVGTFGAEPLHHPNFPDVVDIYVNKLPDCRHRGLWTSLNWKEYVHPRYGAARPHVERLLGTTGRPDHKYEVFNTRPTEEFGYLNWNMHDGSEDCFHSSIFIGIDEVVSDERRRMELISNCPYQRNWSPLIGPDANGEVKFFFCEVAQTHSRVRKLNIGIPLSADCWKHPITFEPDASGVLRPSGLYAPQILAACGGCGGALPLPPRRDTEKIDDVSPNNLVQLQLAKSPMAQRGDVAVFDAAKIAEYSEEAQRTGGWNPVVYLRGKPGQAKQQKSKQPPKKKAVVHKVKVKSLRKQ